MKVSRVLAVIALAGVVATTASAQRIFGGPRDFGSKEMAKIFGKNDAFSAVADMTVVENQGKQTIQMEMNYAFLKGDLRTESDMASMKGVAIPPEAAAHIKQMGMDRTVSIFLTDKHLTYLVYPGLKAFCEISRDQSSPTGTNEDKQAKIEVTELGKETVDGHPCVKKKMTITDDDGTQRVVIAWRATDLKDFPIKAEIENANSTITIHFRDVKLSPPPASDFTPPSDYTRYTSVQEMMMGNMQRFMPPGGEMPPRGSMHPPQNNQE
ncbi:MAG TPA: DUF4412 domain-containing protein [Verrucomicrobiae bacterium]|nr:DUF4412 domain-containing protein [Verrucomicrobiae bacterium]